MKTELHTTVGTAHNVDYVRLKIIADRVDDLWYALNEHEDYEIARLVGVLQYIVKSMLGEALT